MGKLLQACVCWHSHAPHLARSCTTPLPCGRRFQEGAHPLHSYRPNSCNNPGGALPCPSQEEVTRLLAQRPPHERVRACWTNLSPSRGAPSPASSTPARCGTQAQAPRNVGVEHRGVTAVPACWPAAPAPDLRRHTFKQANGHSIAPRCRARFSRNTRQRWRRWSRSCAELARLLRSARCGAAGIVQRKRQPIKAHGNANSELLRQPSLGRATLGERLPRSLLLLHPHCPASPCILRSFQCEHQRWAASQRRPPAAHRRLGRRLSHHRQPYRAPPMWWQTPWRPLPSLVWLL